MTGKELGVFSLLVLLDLIFILFMSIAKQAEKVVINELFFPEVKEVIPAEELENATELRFLSASEILLGNQVLPADSLERHLERVDRVRLELLPEQRSYLSIVGVLHNRNVPMFIPISDPKVQEGVKSE